MNANTAPAVVLVADDEPTMLELVVRHLRSFQQPTLEVLEAVDGDEAWRLVGERLPDLVVLDVMMPGMSGWEVCRKIRHEAALAHTGVLMLTGIGDRLNETTSPLFGADDFIDKPFDFGVFDAKLRTVLEKRATQRDAVPRPRRDGAACTVASADPSRDGVNAPIQAEPKVPSGTAVRSSSTTKALPKGKRSDLRNEKRRESTPDRDPRKRSIHRGEPMKGKTNMAPKKRAAKGAKRIATGAKRGAAKSPIRATKSATRAAKSAKRSSAKVVGKPAKVAKAKVAKAVRVPKRAKAKSVAKKTAKKAKK